MNILLAMAKRATPEQREWLDSFSRMEAEMTEDILKAEGIYHFLRYWHFHKGQLDYARTIFDTDK